MNARASIVVVVALVVAVLGARSSRADQAPPPPMKWNPVVVTATSAAGDGSAFLIDEASWCVDGDGVGKSVKLAFDHPIAIDTVFLPGLPPHEEHEDFRRPSELEIANDANEKVTTKLGDDDADGFETVALDGAQTKSITITIKKAKPGTQKRTCLSGIVISSTTAAYDLLVGVDTKAAALVPTSYASFLDALSSCDATKLAKVTAFPLTHTRMVARAAGKIANTPLKTEVADAAQFATLCRGYNDRDHFPTTSTKPLSFFVERPGELWMQGTSKDHGALWFITARVVDGTWRMTSVSRH